MAANPSAAGPSRAPSFDEKMQRALDEDFEKLSGVLRNALDEETTVRDASGCPKCECKHVRYVKVPDYKLKLQIAEFMANRGFGRPAVAESEQQGLTLVVERNWPVAGNVVAPSEEVTPKSAYARASHHIDVQPAS